MVPPSAPVSQPPTVLGVDQSLTGTGAVLLGADGARREAARFGTSDSSIPVELRIRLVRDRLVRFAAQASPHAVAFEDYARTARSASIAHLIELGSAIKQGFVDAGRPVVPVPLLDEPCFVVQNQSTMKKFVFGKGNQKKGTDYLLAAYKATGVDFSGDGDDIADAHLHALLCQTTLSVMQGRVKLSDLPVHRREAVLAPTVKTLGLTKARAAKLGDGEARTFMVEASLSQRAAWAACLDRFSSTSELESPDAA